MRNLSRPFVHQWLVVALSLCVFAGASAGPASAGGGPKPDARQAKVNVYVDLLNASSPAIRGAHKQYTGWVTSLDTGPTCKETGIRPLGSIGGVMVKKLEAAGPEIAKKPALPVDAAVTKMVAALRGLVEPTNEAGTYYSSAYRKDGCKRGRELHPMLVAGWQAYFDAEAEVRAFVVAYNDELDAKLLASTRKKYGEGFRYYLELQLGHAKALIREITTQFEGDTPDVAAVTAGADALGATLDAVEAMLAKAQATPASKKVFDELYQGGYQRTIQASRNLHQTVAPLLSAVAAAGKPGAAKSAASQVQTQLKNAFNHYNQMIGTLNKVKLSAKVK